MIIPMPLPKRAPDFLAPVWGLLGPQTWVAGGALTRMLEGASKNEGDFDIFAYDYSAVQDELDKSKHVIFAGSSPYSLNYRTVNGDRRIQVVRRHYESLTECLESFDFTVRMVGTDGVTMLMDSHTAPDILHRAIRFHQGILSTPVTSLFSIAKYANRGYTIDYSEAKAFLTSWGVNNLTDFQS